MEKIGLQSTPGHGHSDMVLTAETNRIRMYTRQVSDESKLEIGLSKIGGGDTFRTGFGLTVSGEVGDFISVFSIADHRLEQ